MKKKLIIIISVIIFVSFGIYFGIKYHTYREKLFFSRILMAGLAGGSGVVDDVDPDLEIYGFGKREWEYAPDWEIWVIYRKLGTSGRHPFWHVARNKSTGELIGLKSFKTLEKVVDLDLFKKEVTSPIRAMRYYERAVELTSVYYRYYPFLI